ncbi:hypothetical protein BY996DRAFT_6415917 [Phakopsora pachyrhizi]|nr:hypothetical protein BY996DRAFT_6415917 [Phakopsora pachyrhizi]
MFTFQNRLIESVMAFLDQQYTNIIKNLPAGFKAIFTKQTVMVPSRFHSDAASNCRALGSDTSMTALRSPRARGKRLNLTKKFIDSHCVRNMVGVHPFFESLCAVLYLMSLPARKGGSGKRQIKREINVALFCETGGKVFLKESISFLKGVLGFEDHLEILATPSLKSSMKFSDSDKALDKEDEDGDFG